MSKTIKISLFLFFILIGYYSNPWITSAETTTNREKNLVNLYFFHSNTCSHCIEEEKLLTQLEQKYTNLKVYRYEIHEKENQELLNIAKNIYSIPTSGVPITIIGEEVYQGYREEKSKLEWIQTIEYYSRYSYQDKLGEQIGISALPSYKIEKNNETLEEFMKEYGIYKLIGPITTKQLEPNIIAIITGILIGCNPIFLLTIIPIRISLNKTKLNWRNNFLLLAFYFFSNFLLSITYIIKNKFYNLAIGIVFLILFIWALIKYYQTRKKQYAFLNLIFIITVLANYLSGFYINHYAQIFLNISNIYLLNGLTSLTYYANSFFSMFLIQFLMITALTTAINKIMKKFLEG